VRLHSPNSRRIGERSRPAAHRAVVQRVFVRDHSISNTIIRVNEYEADIFGLNAARQPDGFANAALKLGEYRKLDPGPIEELIFFDHPSGRTRIFSAMRWKKENLQKN
jgi:hypothetical protein